MRGVRLRRTKGLRPYARTMKRVALRLLVRAPPPEKSATNLNAPRKSQEKARMTKLNTSPPAPQPKQKKTRLVQAGGHKTMHDAQRGTGRVHGIENLTFAIA